MEPIVYKFRKTDATDDIQDQKKKMEPIMYKISDDKNFKMTMNPEKAYAKNCNYREKETSKKLNPRKGFCCCCCCCFKLKLDKR